MKSKIILAIFAGLVATTSLQAQTTVIEKREAPSTVVIEKQSTPVVEQRTRIETERSGCATKTVRQENEEGSKTVTKTEC